MDKEVGLLIANDDAPVMQPLEVINTDSGYYAIKTTVERRINCPKKNVVYPKLNKTFLVKLNNHPMCSLCTEVVDANINNSQLLRDQTHFLNFVSTSIRHLDNQHYECVMCIVQCVMFIFILHSRESELYRYILDGKSALA